MQRTRGVGVGFLAVIVGLVMILPAIPARGQVDVSAIRAMQVRETGVVRVDGRWVRRPTLSAVAEADFRGVRPAGPPAGGRRLQPTFTFDVQVNQDLSNRPQDETAVAINPTKRRNVVGGANDYRAGDSLGGYYASFDGGATWQDGVIARTGWPDGSSADGEGDPAIAFDSTGVAYYARISFKRADGRNAIVASRSFNGGLTWSRSVVGVAGSGVVVAETDPASPIFHDKSWVAVDRTGGAHNGRVYVVWVRYDFTGDVFNNSPIYLAYSDDQARTFTVVGEVNGRTPALCENQSDGEPAGRCDEDSFPQPVVLADGRVVVLFENNQNASNWDPADDFDGQYLLTVWDPATRSLAGPYKVTKINDGLTNYPLNNPQDFRQSVCNANFRLNAAGAIARDSVDGGLYVVFADGRRSDFFPFPTYVNPSFDVPASNNCPGGLVTNTNVYLVKSMDNGVTWSDPVSIVRRQRGDQWFPWIDIAPNGTIGVAYFDRSYDVNNKLVHATLSTSRDGGATWKHVRASSKASNMDWAFSFGRFIGDYNGIAIDNQKAYPFWTDARNGTVTVRQSDVFMAPLER